MGKFDEIVGTEDQLTNEAYKHLYSIRLRGAYLEMSCDIEWALTDIISLCISTAERSSQLKEVLFERASMTSKIKMAQYALEKFSPDVYLKYSSCFTSLNKIRTLRNKFAHCKIISPTNDRHTLILEEIKDGKTKHTPYIISDLFEELETFRTGAVIPLLSLWDDIRDGEKV